ncbi:MAG: glycosyltransferase family 1 protein [Devosia sp.]|uniref:glycosyltransferase family 4 protein n=1 Tax=Devosia sp. TaxID=1871048 RepID=UPI001AC10E35|nr:glycosyltransferase family 1 protein [Devosia sp.]MBN9314708.1 glycosyltransferase family 1 protein [Devosia sp.]
MLKVLIVTDAWRPQTNGVVRCLDAVGRELMGRGHSVSYLTPEGFWTFPMPTYPEIRLSLVTPMTIAEVIGREAPDCIHIATEGPLGLLARYICLEQGLAFTTSYHTRFPEYVAARMPIPAHWTYGFLRWFHEPAAATLVPTASMQAELAARGFAHTRLWTRGVDHARFAPGEKTEFAGLPGPHLLYVGRVSVEKNVEAFLELDVRGTRIVVGDGPARAELAAKYPDAVFLGLRTGDELSAIYRSADVFVFPSRTDTFGNVMIEALASGLPVAAYPVTGPADILTDPKCGAIDEDLAAAVTRALALDGEAARRHALSFTWASCADIFLDALVPVRCRFGTAAAA